MVLFAVEEKEHGAGPRKLSAWASSARWRSSATRCCTSTSGTRAGPLVRPDLPRASCRGAELPISQRAGAASHARRPARRLLAQYYNLVSILTNTLIGFLSIACFLPERRPGAAPDRRRPRRREPAGSRSPVAAARRLILAGLSCRHGQRRRGRARRTTSSSASAPTRRPSPRSSAIGGGGALRGLSRRSLQPDLHPRPAASATGWSRPRSPPTDRFARLARQRGGALAARRADRRCEGRPALRPGHAALRLRERRARRRAAHGRGLLADRLRHRGLLPRAQQGRHRTRRCSASSAGRRPARSCCRPASATPSASGRASAPSPTRTRSTAASRGPSNARGRFAGQRGERLGGP